MPSVELVLFAIQAGVRLGQEARRAYVDETKQRRISVPLPKFDPGLDAGIARLWFSGDGKDYIKDASLRVSRLHKRGVNSLDETERREYVELYRTYYAIELARGGRGPVELVGDTRMAPDQLLSLITFKQWQADDPGNPRTLSRVVGTIVEIGIDYAVSVPGVLDRSTRQGKVIAGFVEAIEPIEFAEISTQADRFDRIVGLLLVAALETVAALPETIGSDRNTQRLVRIAAEGLSVDLTTRIGQLGNDQLKGRLEDWGEFVFRSLLASAGRAVVQEPGTYLGMDKESEGALVRNIGNGLIDLAIRDEHLDLERVFGREGLDVIVRAALATVGDHPELVNDTDNRGIRALISESALAIAKISGLPSQDIMPEILRIILERTGANLELIWPTSDPEEHLLLTAARTTLEILTAPANGASWPPRFRQRDLIRIVDAVLDELSTNPGWLLAAARDIDANLAIALTEALAVLRTHADEWLGPGLGTEMLVEAVRAISLRAEFLEEVDGARTAVAAVFEAVVREVFNPELAHEVHWQLVREETLLGLVRISLREFAGSAMDAEALARLEGVVEETVSEVADGAAIDLDAFEGALRDAASPDGT